VKPPVTYFSFDPPRALDGWVDRNPPPDDRAAEVQVTTLVIGAGGRTGSRVLRLMTGIGLPVIGLARDAERVKALPSLRRAQLASADLLRDPIGSLLSAVQHVIYLAGGAPEADDGAEVWRREVLALSRVLTAATRARLSGSFVYVVPIDGSQPHASMAWQAAKRSAAAMVVNSGLRHLILRVPPLTEDSCPDPRLRLELLPAREATPRAEGPLARDALAPLIVGALVARHVSGLQVDVRPAGGDGLRLHEAVHALCRGLGPETTARRLAGAAPTPPFLGPAR
jgi:uncharacterized protein YbjT (DUF2867 family)